MSPPIVEQNVPNNDLAGLSLGGNNNLVLAVDASRRNIVNINSNYKEFAKRVRNTWKINVYNGEVTFDKLKENKIFITGGPREKYTTAECEALKKHVEDGRGLLVMLSEGGETRLDTNINFVLEQFGVEVNPDVVIRTSYYKYFHPKEVLVANGVLNRSLSQAAGKTVLVDENANNSQAISFLYPFGATLNVVKPSIPVLSTGSVSLPLNRPVCAMYENQAGGKLVVLGSCHMFHDNYIDKEENFKILDVVLDFLATDRVRLDPIDAADPEVADYTDVPDVAMLAEQPKSCLHESDDIPSDVTRLFDHTIFSINSSVVPTVIKAYDELKVKHEQLTLISPQFETPLLPLEPATFMPHFRDLNPPKLDLFDLDDMFSSAKVRLAQLTNKCTTDDDLEYFVRECGHILGVTQNLPGGSRDARHVLDYIFTQLVEFKKLEDDGSPPQAGSASSTAAAASAATAQGSRATGGGGGNYRGSNENGANSLKLM